MEINKMQIQGVFNYHIHSLKLIIVKCSTLLLMKILECFFGFKPQKVLCQHLEKSKKTIKREFK